MEDEQPPIEAEDETSGTPETRIEKTERALKEYTVLLDDTWGIKNQDDQYIDEINGKAGTLARIVDDNPGNDGDYYRLVSIKDELVEQVGRQMISLEDISANLVFPAENVRDEIIGLLRQIETEQDAQELQRLKTQAIDSFQTAVIDLANKRQEASQARSAIYNVAADNEGSLGYGVADDLTENYRRESRRFSDGVQVLNIQMDRLGTNFLKNNNEHLENFSRILDEISLDYSGNPPQST